MTPKQKQFHVAAYVTENIVADVIPYERLTHMHYSFLIPNNDGTFKPIANAWKLEKIVAQARAKNVSVLISVGGWGWDREFEIVAADPALRSTFVANLKAFLDQYQLDGVDLDWEYPDAGESAQNFLALIREMRAAMPQALISSAVVAYGDDVGLGIPQESFALMDYVVVMTYSGKDHGTQEQFHKGIDYWSARGLPKEKLIIGLPFYSEPGGIAYAKIAQADPSAAQVDSFNYLGVIENYNGIPTIQWKTKFALENAGGVAFWTLDHDAQGDLSLLKAIADVIHQK